MSVISDVNWDTATIRDLLMGAFNDEELTALCFDGFPEVYEGFAVGMSKGQKIQRLLDYCARHAQIAKLLDHIREQNPIQYAKYVARLKPASPPPPAYHPSILPELPDDLCSLVLQNRSHELALLRDHTITHRLTTITGVGGIGKTTLARALVELRPAEVPPPMWVNFADEPDINLDNMLGQFAGYLNWPELLIYRQERRPPGRGDVARLIDRLRELLPLWIVLDNLESALDDEGRFSDIGLESLFEALMTRQHQARLIVSSRMLPVLRNISVIVDGLGKGTLELRGLSQTDGVALLHSEGLEEIPETQLARLVQRVSGHPLALRFLLTEVQLWGIARLLAESDLWQAGNIAEFGHQLFARLQPAEQQLLASFSVFRQPQPPALLVALAGGWPAGQQTFRLLIRKSLLGVARSGDPPLYSLHPLVRELAEAELDTDERQRAHFRACQHYLSLELPPMSAWRDLGDIIPLIEAHHHAFLAGAFDRAAAILLEYALPDYLEQWGAQERLIKLSRQTFGDVPKGKLYANYLGEVGYDKLLNSGVDIVERARLYRQLGKCSRFLGEYERALASYEQGITLLHGGVDERELARLYSESAFVLYELGQRQKALERCQQGLKLIEGAHDRQSQIDEAGLQMRMGIVLLAKGEHAQAFSHFEQAHIIYQGLGMTSRAYEAYDNLGVTLQRQRRYQEALTYFNAVKQYYEKIGYWLGIAQAGLNVGTALHYLQRYEEARLGYENSLHWFDEIGDQKGCLLSLCNLGELRMDTGDGEAALHYLEQALARSEAIGEREHRPVILCLLGKAHARLGHVVTARDRLEQAIVAAVQSENRGALEDAQRSLAEIAAT
jgi:tetratricopeptide (TPR) repeat protein